MFRYYLDDNLVNDPENWKDFEEVLEYDIENNSFLYTYPLELEFNGGLGYSYLKEQSDVANCSFVVLRIQQNICGNYENIFIGNIFLSDITIDRVRCKIKAPVQDNGFTSFINNNKSIKASLREDGTGAVSKNGVSLTNELGITEISVVMFNPATGAQPSTTAVAGMYIYDCFKYLIAYLSDLQVDFESNFLDRFQTIALPKHNVKRLVLTTGENIYLGAQNTSNTMLAITSLGELIKEVSRFYQIGYYMRYDFNGRPTFVLEDIDYFLKDATSVSFTELTTVEEKRANEVYYSNIRIGGNAVLYDTNTSVLKFEDEELYTFDEENYYFGGECNIDKELNLTGTFIVDTNTIQLLSYNTAGGLVDAFNTYRERNFFIEVLNVPSGGFDNAYKIINSNNSYYHYNENLINSKVLERFNSFGDIYYNSTLNVYTLINQSDKNYLKKYTFTKFINSEDYKSIKAAITSRIKINIDLNGTQDEGWIKRISRKFATGESQIELRA